jgi:hypothetical protein
MGMAWPATWAPNGSSKVKEAGGRMDLQLLHCPSTVLSLFSCVPGRSQGNSGWWSVGLLAFQVENMGRKAQGYRPRNRVSVLGTERVTEPEISSAVLSWTGADLGDRIRRMDEHG